MFYEQRMEQWTATQRNQINQEVREELSRDYAAAATMAQQRQAALAITPGHAHALERVAALEQQVFVLKEQLLDSESSQTHLNGALQRTGAEVRKQHQTMRVWSRCSEPISPMFVCCCLLGLQRDALEAEYQLTRAKLVVSVAPHACKQRLAPPCLAAHRVFCLRFYCSVRQSSTSALSRLEQWYGSDDRERTQVARFHGPMSSTATATVALPVMMRTAAPTTTTTNYSSLLYRPSTSSTTTSQQLPAPRPSLVPFTPPYPHVQPYSFGRR